METGNILKHAATAAFSIIFLPPLQASRGIPWWVYLLIIVVLIIIIAWALASNRDKSPVEPHRTDTQNAGSPGTASTTMSASAPPTRAEVFTAAAPAAPLAPPPTPDDLTIIEGIGPKISAILHDSGIHTFADLAQTDVEELKRILTASGLQFTDPRSWADQARLAAAGDQAGLQALQDRLKGGRQE